MVEINENSRTIKAKLVYYGPAVGGKTTNLRFLQDNAVRDRRGMMISVNSTQERTILFDLLPLRTIGFRGYDLRLQVIGVAGQSMYAPSRKSALKDADGLVFVANSAVDRWEENVQAFGEMTQGLVANGIDISEMPFVLQYNKRDLPESTPIDVMERGLNPRSVPALPAVACEGDGVLETFAAILEATVRRISRQYTHLELPSGLTPEAWTQVAIRGMFGRTSFGKDAPSAPTPMKIQTVKTVRLESGTAPARPAPPPPTVIKIAPGKGPDGRLDNRSPEAVAESYAEASAELGMAVAEMRDERDAVLDRLEEVQRSIEVAHDLMSAESGEQAYMRVLSCLAESAEATHATLLVRPGGDLQARPLPPLKEDPILSSGAALHWLEQLQKAEQPQLKEAASDEGLREIMEGAEPPFSAVLAVPVRDTQSVFAIAMLYFAGDMPLPSPDRVAHVGVLARIFSAPLELGTLREYGPSLARLRYLLTMSDAAAAWAIASLSRGGFQRESVDLTPFLVPLSDLGVDLSLEFGTSTVSAPPDLIHLGLLSLIGGFEARDPGGVSVRCGREGEFVRVDIAGRAPTDSSDDEAVIALVQWMIETCCEGRFETSSEAGTSKYSLLLHPA
jgi:hypothetical protein